MGSTQLGSLAPRPSPLVNSHLAGPQPSTPNPQLSSAYIPFNYISDARQRIEIYRKLAQATDKPVLEELRKELKDRFGPLPPPVGLLLQVAEVKILAAERGITIIEVKEPIYANVRDVPDLPEGDVRNVLEYFDDFFKVIENPGAVRREFVRNCRTIQLR